MTNYFFFTANVFFTIGTILLSRQVLKNRSSLKDYDLVGASLTLSGLVVMQIGYYQLRDVVNMLFALPTLSFWAIVVFFVMLHRRRA